MASLRDIWAVKTLISTFAQSDKGPHIHRWATDDWNTVESFNGQQRSL